MSLGERGGSTANFEEGAELVESFKQDWSELIRLEIKNCLLFKGEFHASDLVDLNIPADSKNCVGAAVMAAVRRGWMVETGERRASTDKAGHSRKSNVYRSLLGITTSHISSSRSVEGPGSGDPAQADAVEVPNSASRKPVEGTDSSQPSTGPQLSLLGEAA